MEGGGGSRGRAGRAAPPVGHEGAPAERRHRGGGGVEAGRRRAEGTARTRRGRGEKEGGRASRRRPHCPAASGAPAPSCPARSAARVRRAWSGRRQPLQRGTSAGLTAWQPSRACLPAGEAGGWLAKPHPV